MRLREFSRTDCPATGSPKRLDVLVRPGVVPPASATESVRIASLGAETSSMTPMEVGSLTKATTGLVIADADPPRVRPRRPVGLRAPPSTPGSSTPTATQPREPWSPPRRT